MVNQRNVLTVLGCSSSLMLALAVAQPADAADLSETPDAAESGLVTLVHNDSNPIMDALSCSCARCLLSQGTTL
ncbi:MAG: hypothetical protein AAF821_22875 [Cyanobacteria bacterium P01_D01_bin.156]